MAINKMANVYDYQSANVHRTWIMFAVFFVVVIAIGYVFSIAYGDPSFIVFAVIFTVVYSLISYYSSAKIALSMARARRNPKNDNPMLWNVVENLCIADGLPMPKLYITPEMQINAFATGRDNQHAAVAVTQGALQRLNKTELEGVLAHELSHVKNRDIHDSTVEAILAGIIAHVADVYLRSIFSADSAEAAAWARQRRIAGNFLYFRHHPFDPRADRHDADPACHLAPPRSARRRERRIA